MFTIKLQVGKAVALTITVPAAVVLAILAVLA